MFQDLHVVDFHAHFPIKGDVPASTGQAERDRAAWRLAWDFPEPEPEARDQPVEAIADRWLAELDRYGIDRVGFATGGGNDTLARAVARYPARFIGFAHNNPFQPGAADEMRRAANTLGLKSLKILAPARAADRRSRPVPPLGGGRRAGRAGADPLRHARRRGWHLME